MLVRCCVCGAGLTPVPVDVDDPTNGKTSHGYCGPCERQALAEVEAMQIPAVMDVEPDDDRDDCDDCCDCDACCGDDVDVPEREELGARSYLTGLGLWQLPDSFWVALFIPYALLALGGGR